ncbi:hypothetical protein [Micromonospora sp. NPDC047074]|uniref:hypothetical protein n=1 Tax=Micromonospora sp. NPDC047074 TaxID=3154339 RepID=UPI00340AC284
MSRVLRIVAAVLVSGALAACGSDEAPEAAIPPPTGSTVTPGVEAATPAASGATPEASSAAPASPASAAPSAAGGGGYANPDEAIANHLAAVSGVRYLGLCKNAKRDPEAVCALRKAFVGRDEVYGLGAPHSEIVAFLLLRDGTDGWRVVDDHTPDGKVTPPAWMATVR